MWYDIRTRPVRPRAPSELYSKYVQARVAILMSLAEIFIWCCHNMSSPQPHGPFFCPILLMDQEIWPCSINPLSRLIHPTAHNHPSHNAFYLVWSVNEAACPLVWFSSTTVTGGPGELLHVLSYLWKSIKKNQVSSVTGVLAPSSLYPQCGSH